MWYVIQVKTGNEEKVCAFCRQLVDDTVLQDCFLPKTDRRQKKQGVWRTVQKVLFPGYIFLVTEDSNELFRELKKVPEFTKLLGDESGFIPLYEQEEAFLRKICDDNYVVAMSEGYMVGDKVYVTSGAMAGLEGCIKKIDRHKRQAILSIQFFGRITEVTMGLEIVERRDA